MAIRETSDEQLNKVLNFVDEYLESTVDARELSEKCRDYRDNYQWTDAEITRHRNRNQPTITNNRIKPKVQFLLGMETQNRTDPKALPRTPNDEKSGEVSTDALRFVEERNKSDQEFSDGFENYIVEGVEGHEVIAVERRGKMEVEHNLIPWDRMFWDAHSRRKDFKDWRYHGTLQWMDDEEARDKFPDAPDEFFTFSEHDVTDSDTMDDKPADYIDKERKRVRVFFCYFLEKGVWNYCVFSGGGFAVRPTVSPYLDENGEPESQFVFRAAFVDRHGNRYGEVASMLDLQDEVNHRHSKFLHDISVRQTWSNKGAVQDVHAFKREMSKADGHLEFTIGEWGKDFGVIPTGDMAQGQLLLLQEAKSNMDVEGANSILQGQQEAGLSGRAIQSLQQGGVIELGSLFDGHKACRMDIYRMMFNRVKQFWTEERWVRVLGDDSKLKWTGINRQITARDKFIEEVGEEEWNSLPEHVKNDPRLDTVVGIENPMNELDVDIIMDAPADTLSLQHEQFDLLAKMYQANPQAVPFQLVLKASQLRNKDELIKILEGGDDDQQAALIQARQQQEQERNDILKAAAIADIKETESVTAKNMASAEKMQVEAEETAIDAAIKSQEATEPLRQTI